MKLSVIGLYALLWIAVLVAPSKAFQCTRGRLFLMDDNAPRVVSYDIDEGTFQNPMSIATQGVTPAIRLARATSTNAFVAIINLGTPSFSPGPNDIGTVSFINAGVTPDVHSVSVTKTTPTLVDFHINCTFPVHFVSNHRKIAQFCDGSLEHNINSTIWIIDESKLLDPTQSPLEYSMELAGSHHGVAVAVDDGHLLHSITPAERLAGGSNSLPDGFQVLNYDSGNVIHGINEAADPSRSCLGFHGDSHVGDSYAFACNQTHGGILLVNYGQTPLYTSRAVSYPDGFEAHRTGTLTSHHGNSHVVGNFGAGDDNHLVAFDPQQTEPTMTMAQVQSLAASQCAFTYERSGGQLLFVWMPHGNLQTYLVDPWTLVSDVQVISNMTECTGTSLVPGHGYAYVLQGSTMHEVDVRDTAKISVASFDLGFQIHGALSFYTGVVVGVPSGYECSAPTAPTHPEEGRTGAEGFGIVHLEDEDLIPPGSPTQTRFLLQLRGDVARALSVSIDRIYVLQFGHGFDAEAEHHDHDNDDHDILVEFFFADPSPFDVNQLSGAKLKANLTALLDSEDSSLMSGTASGLLEGTITNEPPAHAQDHNKNNNNDDNNDGWPTGAIAAVAIVGVLSVLAAAAAVVYYKREQKAVFDLEQLKKGESA